MSHAFRRIGIACLFVVLAAPDARSESIPPAKLKAVKNATVLIRVTLPNGHEVSGSGFFAHAPGLVMTNAHVLGMLEPDSPKPNKVEVVVRSGEPDSTVLKGEVVGVDGDLDLGLIRVEGSALPEMLPLESAKDLIETVDVYAFGFPFGEQLGKNITVSKTSISSLRTNSQGRLERIQVAGGINPGNSGGPVIDTSGRVVGVAVSGIRNTQIQFAIPSDTVAEYLSGRAARITHDLPYRSGDKVLQPISVRFADPLGRVQKVALECFTGKNGPTREAADKAPASQPGDSPARTFPLSYDPKTGEATGEVECPTLSADQCFFVRPTYADGVGKPHWGEAKKSEIQRVLNREPIELHFRPSGELRPISLENLGTFRLRNAEDEEFTFTLQLKTRVTEISSVPEKARRQGQLKSTGLTWGFLRDGKLDTSPEMKEIAFDTKFARVESQYETAGSRVNVKADVSGVPLNSKKYVSNVIDQALQSLDVATIPMPNREVKPLETWSSKRKVGAGVSALTLNLTGKAVYLYTYLGQSTNKEGQPTAYIRIEGTIHDVETNDGKGGSFRGVAEVNPVTGETISCEVNLKADAEIKLSSGRKLMAMCNSLVRTQQGDFEEKITEYSKDAPRRVLPNTDTIRLASPLPSQLFTPPPPPTAFRPNTPQPGGPYPGQPGYVPIQPGYVPNRPGYVPNQPGYLPNQPGYVPNQPGYPGQPGYPNQPGYPPGAMIPGQPPRPGIPMPPRPGSPFPPRPGFPR